MIAQSSTDGKSLPLPGEDVVELLIKTSRTFAVSIPLLDVPTRDQVSVAYLLFRIADTFEDAAAWPREQRIEGLSEFAQLVSGERDDGKVLARRWVGAKPVAHAGYIELLAVSDRVVASALALGQDVREVVSRHTLRTIEGMTEFARRSDSKGAVRLRSMQDLRDYCYVVAGIVGELLTDLFVLAAPQQLRAGRAQLDARAVQFGEALQLVNIVKDAADDRREGRSFLPPDTAMDDVFTLCRHDIELAKEYVELLRHFGAPQGQVAFTALPLRLAEATLQLVERDGAGAKISRAEVADHVSAVHRALRSQGSLFERD